MKLKKNDKIILIIGVVILIAAGAGIALYTVDDSDGAQLAENSEDTYSFTWTKNTGQMNIGSDLYAGKNAPYENTIPVNAPSNTVLTKIDIELSWEDDSTYGLLKKNKGLDMLNAEISHNSDIKTITSEGGGNETASFMINNIPMDDTVVARSEPDAKDLVDDLIAGHNTANFDFTVTVTPGEKMLRPLKYLKDKGNSFDLTATYTYYTYELENGDISEETNDETKETGKDFGHNIGEFYINLGYGRGMI